MKINLKKTTLFLGLFMTLPAVAEDTVIPQVVHPFVGEMTGIFAPPVWSPQQQLIIGTTMSGGESYSVPGYPGVPGYEYTVLDSGRAFSLALDGSGFASTSMGGGAGHFFTSHLLDRNGDVWGGSTYAASSLAAAEALRWGAVTRLGGNLTITSYRPAGLAVDKQFQLRGQLAEDSLGNVYAADGYAAPNTADKTNRLLRVTPDGTVETVIDYTVYAKPFRTQGSTVRYWLAKGNSPYAIVWSDNDDALYLVSSTGTGTATEPHAGQPAVYCEAPPEGGEFFRPDCRDGTFLRGHLIRISGEALRGELPVAEDAIEILFHFTVGTGGEIATNDSSELTSVVESGDFLYGISTTVKDSEGASGQGIWRIRKSGVLEAETVADTFTTVHRFAPVADQERVDNPLDNDSSGIIGNHAYGPLVVAVDGNIYGTTPSDDRMVTKSGSATRPTYTPSGAGTIFRIVTGTAVDRADDKLEHVYGFVEDVTGKTPKGLSAGPIENGKQWIIGATASGSGSVVNGAIVKFGVDVPPIELESFTATPANIVVGDNQTITLQWSVKNAYAPESCFISVGDSTDYASLLNIRQNPQGTEELNVPTVAANLIFTLSCTDNDGTEKAFTAEGQQPVVTVTAAPVVPEVPQTPEDNSSGSGGSFGSLMLVSLGLYLAGFYRRRSLIRAKG